MTNSIKDQIDVLVKLQTVENESQRLRSALNSTDSRLDDLDRSLQDFEQVCQAKKQQLDDLRKTYRDHDRKVQELRLQIEKSEEKTRSVKTNKEYQSLLKEIDDLNNKIAFIEDEMLDILEQMESVETDVKRQLDELKDLKIKVDQEKAIIQDDAIKQKTCLDALLKERLGFEDQLTLELSNRYRSVKAKVGELAISAVKKAVCQGCHVNIPPQLCNELQRCDTLLQCPNCQRIIYYYDVIKRSE